MSGKKRILQLLSDAVDHGVFPGAILLVALRKQILFLEAVGSRTLFPTPQPMTPQTRFDLASLSKPLGTTLAVLCLLSQGALQLDAPLAELLPPGLVPPDKLPITLRQLLCHCSGLPGWRPYYTTLDTLSPRDRKKQLRLQVLQEPLECSPGTCTTYSDLGFLLVEWILEEANSQDLHRFTRHHLYEPLGCGALGYLPLDGKLEEDQQDFAATERCPWRKRIIIGQVHDENAHVVGGIAGHAGLFGTAAEVKCILDTILDTLSSESDHIPWSRQDLTSFLQPARLDPTSTWGLGFDTPAVSGSSGGQHFSAESVGHLGFTGTSFWLDLQKEMAVILLSNRIHPSRTNEKIRKFRPLIHDAVMEEFA